jgi:NitT/TauT family transport system permease protein
LSVRAWGAATAAAPPFWQRGRRTVGALLAWLALAQIFGAWLTVPGLSRLLLLNRPWVAGFLLLLLGAALIGDPYPPKRRALRLAANYALLGLIWLNMNWALGDVVFPSVAVTVEGAVRILTTPVLLAHVGLTLLRTLLGVIVSAALGVITILIVRYVTATQAFFLDVFYPVTRAIPTVSIALLAIVWFKLDTGAVVFVVLVTVLPIYLIQLWEGLKVVDATLIEMAQVFSRKRLLIFRKVVAPMLVPTLFSATKLGFSVSFKLALVGELLAATNGMGFMLQNAQQELRMEMVFAWTLWVVVLVVFFDYYLFDFVERKWLYRWESGA